MSALTFDKNELGNLEYSLQREVLSTDRRGGYMSTTIVCCNTRRYHGLMVAPIGRGDQTCVLLSSLDETIVQHDQSRALIHRTHNTQQQPVQMMQPACRACDIVRHGKVLQHLRGAQMHGTIVEQKLVVAAAPQQKKVFC